MHTCVNNIYYSFWLFMPCQYAKLIKQGSKVSVYINV